MRPALQTAPPRLGFKLDAAQSYQSTVTPSQAYTAVASGGGYTIATTNEILRSQKPTGLFSFNVPIGAVQQYKAANDFEYYMLDWKPNQWRGQIVPWLAALGQYGEAWLRYPGGTDSQGFDLRGSLGPRHARPSRNFVTVARPEYFGFWEFMELCRDTGYKPFYTLLSLGYSTGAVTKFSDAAFLAEIQAILPYIAEVIDNPFIELGNEEYLDATNFPLASDWVTRFVPVVTAVRAALPGAKIINQACERDDLNPRGGADAAWNNDVFAMPDCDGWAIHPYYDGNSVPLTRGYLEARAATWQAIVGGKNRIYCTEHARWPALATQSHYSRVTGMEASFGGALSALDWIIMCSQKPNIDMAFLHNVAGIQWPLFDGPLLKKGDWSPTPVYWALLIALKTLQKNTLGTLTTSANASSYGGGYDVRGWISRDDAGAAYGLVAINRNTADVSVTLTIPALANQSKGYTERCIYQSDTRSRTIIAYGTDISVDTTDDSFNGPAGKFSAFQSGDLICSGGFANAGNRVAEMTAQTVAGDGSKITVDANLTTASAGTFGSLGVWRVPKLKFENLGSKGLHQGLMPYEAPATGTLNFNGSGQATVTLRASSVSGFVIA